MVRCIRILPAVLALAATVVQAGDATYFGGYDAMPPPAYDGYTTASVYVPARDGTRLAVDVMLPRGLDPDTPVPAVMNITRYWRATALRWPFSRLVDDPVASLLTSHGYALVRMDVRGTGASFGTWDMPYAPAETVDAGSDVVAWIVAQPWSNGRVGAIGTSYPGSSAALLPVPNHPAVKAVIPRFVEFDVYADLPFPGGVANRAFLRLWDRANAALDANDFARFADLQHLGWMARVAVKGVRPVDADEDGSMLAAAVAAHAGNMSLAEVGDLVEARDQVLPGTPWTLDDVSIHTRRAEIERSGAAYFVWGSWTDASTAAAALGLFFTFDVPGQAVIGAWSHGAEFDTDPFHPPDQPVWPSQAEQMLSCLRFFDHHLKGVDTGMMSARLLHYYTMGADRWQTTDRWPPEGTRKQRWYLAGAHELMRTPPESADGIDAYRVDYEHTTGTTNRWYTQLNGADVVYDDRAAQLKRTLSYASAPLTSELEITGHPVVHLNIASSHDSGAVFAYLDAEAPDGTVRYITDGRLNLRFQQPAEGQPPYRTWVPYRTFTRASASPWPPDEVRALAFGMLPTSVVVPKGYRLRFSIAGADADNFNRYPADGVPTLQIARDRMHASYVELPVHVPGG